MQGDSGIDDHHTIEDVGILLRAFNQAIGDKRGIKEWLMLQCLWMNQ